MATPSLSLRHHFAALKDPRRTNRRRHLLIDVLTIALCAVLCGAEDWHQIADFGRRRLDWLRRFLELPHGAPSHDTYERVFAALDPVAFQRRLIPWLHALWAQLPPGQVALDGKALRRSGSKARDLKALNLVSAWATGRGISLGQVAVAEGSNEITAIPELLELLELKGALVTADAIACQKAVAAKVREKGADYLLAVKTNQEALLGRVQAVIGEALDQPDRKRKRREHEARGVAHGRREERYYLVTYDVGAIREELGWPDLAMVGVCRSEREVNGKVEEHLRYYIGSRRLTAEQFAAAARGHWGIENELHWRLDVQFGEDLSRVRDRNGAANLGAVRRLALTLLKQHPSKDSIARKRFQASLDTALLEEILAPSGMAGNL